MARDDAETATTTAASGHELEGTGRDIGRAGQLSVYELFVFDVPETARGGALILTNLVTTYLEFTNDLRSGVTTFQLAVP